MILEGKVWKDGTLWPIECPAIGAFTQGRSKKDAFAMMTDWIWTMLDDDSVQVEFDDLKDGSFKMTVGDPQKVYALMIHHARNSQRVTLKELADRLQLKSRGNAKHYETGKHALSVTKFHEVMRALGFAVQVSVKKLPEGKRGDLKRRRAG